MSFANTPPEGFVPVPGHPRYWVNSEGVVLGQRGQPLRGRVTHPSRPGNLPYRMVALYDGTGMEDRVDRFVHYLVLEAFVGPRPEGMEARHLNGDPGDNHLNNLAWGTREDNAQDKVAHRTHCRCGLPLEGENLVIRNNGKPNGARCCRACLNRRSLESYYRRRDRNLRSVMAG